MHRPCTGHAQAMSIYSQRALLSLNRTVVPETIITKHKDNTANSLINFYKVPLSIRFILPLLSHLIAHTQTRTHSFKSPEKKKPTKSHPKMKFSTILAVLPVAFAASGTLKAKLAAREDGCVKYVSLKKMENSHTQRQKQ